MTDIDALLRAVVAEQPYPLMFATISGAHLYGFPSPDSDYDLRGVHLIPLRDVLGLHARRETVEISLKREGVEIDLVTHELEKFCQLLLRPNGLLEYLCSPLVVHTTPTHAALRDLVPRLVTRHYVHHYLGFATSQWRMFENGQPRRVKPLLYVFRGLLTGLHLMRTGEVEANILKLNEIFQLPYLPELVARKLAGGEQGILGEADVTRYADEYARLRAELEATRDSSQLPAAPPARAELSDLLVQVRLAQLPA